MTSLLIFKMVALVRHLVIVILSGSFVLIIPLGYFTKRDLSFRSLFSIVLSNGLLSLFSFAWATIAIYAVY